jgi:hypothetical protein
LIAATDVTVCPVCNDTTACRHGTFGGRMRLHLSPHR